MIIWFANCKVNEAYTKAKKITYFINFLKMLWMQQVMRFWHKKIMECYCDKTNYEAHKTHLNRSFWIPCQNDRKMTDLMVKNFRTGSNGWRSSLRIFEIENMNYFTNRKNSNKITGILPEYNNKLIKANTFIFGQFFAAIVCI